MRRILTALVSVALLAFFVLACCCPISQPTKTGTTSKTPSPSTQTTPKPEKTEYNVGDVIKLGARSITVGTMIRNYDSPNEYMNPPDGKEWVVVPVSIINDSDQAVSFASTDFKIQDSKGTRTYTTFIMDLENQLQFGEIAPKGKAGGNLPFEVPAGDAPLKLIFKPMWGFEGEVVVNL